jgi:hypothetical protein
MAGARALLVEAAALTVHTETPEMDEGRAQGKGADECL